VSSQQFETIARRAEASAAGMTALAQRLRSLGSQALSAIGGTATGEDKAMIELAKNAAARSRLAAEAYTQAAQAARRAAAEAAQREAAEKSKRKSR